jgi:soluble lytic murein transglycosylase
MAPAAAPGPATAALPQAVTDAAREQDAIFLQLREAARQNDAAKAAELAARLPNYAIPSYVDYYRLKPR